MQRAGGDANIGGIDEKINQIGTKFRQYQQQDIWNADENEQLFLMQPEHKISSQPMSSRKKEKRRCLFARMQAGPKKSPL